MKLNKFFHHKINAIGESGGGGGETAQTCADKGTDFNSETGMCVAYGTTGDAAGTGTYRATTLTLADIQEQIAALDAQLLEQGLEEGTAEYEAAQKQARAELVKYATESAAFTFSEEDFAEAVGLTPAEALAEYYNYDFTGKELFNFPYGEAITTSVTTYNNSPQGKAVAAQRSLFDADTEAKLAAGSWTPQMVTRGDTKDAAGNVILGGVQSPTDYELMTSAQLAPFLPTAPYDVTKISQNTPAYTAAGSLPAGLFDPINFPERAITRGTPVITKGFDAAGNPTTGITMGQTTAAPTGANIGQLNTTAQLPTTGMHIAGTGLGGTTVGTMDTTGNIVSTGADNLTQLVDVNNALNTSSVSPTVINTGEEEGVVVTPTVVTMDEVPGSVAYCALYPDAAVCTAGTDEFCALAGNLNHASCDKAKTCPDGEESWNGVCVPICDVGFTRDSDGICQSNNQGNCPAGTDKAGDTIPDGQTVDWCTTTTTITTCPAGTDKAGDTIPDGQTVDWCTTTGAATCDLGTDRAGMAIPANQDSAWCNCGVGYEWDAETKECVLAGSVDPWAADKLDCANAGGTWNTNTNKCDAAVDPYAAEKAACANTGGTWDDTTDPESCTPATVVPTCPATSTNNAGVIIPDGQTLDSFCCPTGEAWNASTNQCEPSGTAVTNVCATGTLRAGAPVPAGKPATWCDLACPVGETWDTETLACATVTVVDPSIQAACETSGGAWIDGACVCPEKSTLIGGQCMADAIGPGVPSYCPAGSVKEGQQIPTGQTVETWCDTVVDPWAADKTDCANAGGTWNNTTNSCDTVVAGIDPYAAEKAVCANTVGGATWDDVNNICVPAAIGDRFSKEKAFCATMSGQYWDESYMACLPIGWKDEGPLDQSGIRTNKRYQTGNELLDQTYAYQSALSTNPVGTYDDPYSMGPDIGVVAAKGDKAPAIPTNLGTSLTPGIHSINFGDGQLVGDPATSNTPYAWYGGADIGFGAKGGEVKEGGFRHGGEVEDRLGLRQKASDSRLMRHGGLGQFADEIGDDMLSTIARIMDRRD